ncbi:MAG: S41 family peptidase [Candidatus Zixiibacteriota bacterium]
MNNERRFRLYTLFLAVAAAATIWIVGSGEATPHREAVWAQTDGGTVDTDRSRNLMRETLYKYTRLLNDISFRIQSNYMDTVNTKDMVYAGIRGMLDVLDPFSVLMEQRNYDQLMESTHGKYEGLGMQIDRREDTITIIAPIEGTPAQRVGLQAGDRIVAIDGKPTFGMTTEQAAKLMRGPAGTKVVLTIVRAGLHEPLDYTVDRAVIELKSVPYYGMADEQNKIGYLRLNKFSETTDQELREALTDLKNQGARSLIFDLRYNGGGLLDQAVKTSNLFLAKDKLIVYTQGRDPESQHKYFSSEDPVLPDLPLVVLVDEGTASASEIVSGAIQDWDRGLIVGNTTFGKGLVQQVFRLPETDDVALKLTTARYYIPSGRSIQKPSRATKHPGTKEEADDDSLVDKPRSDAEVYYTNKGRKVFGGGGVVPDVLVERQLSKPLEIDLWRQGKFFNFAVHYTATHPNASMDFVADDAVLEAFRQYLRDDKFDFKTETEVELDKITADLKDDPARQAIYEPTLAQMRELVAREKELAFDESQDLLKGEIRRAVLNKLYGERGYYEGYVLREDQYVQRAREILTSKDEYRHLLAGDRKS